MTITKPQKVYLIGLLIPTTLVCMGLTQYAGVVMIILCVLQLTFWYSEFVNH
jgi:hypothetical protein